MFVGLLFYIPEHNDTQIGNSEFSAPSGSKTLVVVVVVIVDVAPLGSLKLPALLGAWACQRQRAATRRALEKAKEP